METDSLYDFRVRTDLTQKAPTIKKMTNKFCYIKI